MKILDNGVAVLKTDTHVSRWVEQEGKLCHDKCVELYFLKHVPVGGLVVDGGAFIGDHTTAYLDKVGPTGRVLAFEPNPVAFDCLKHNCPRAECWPVALGEHFATSNLTVLDNAGATHLSSESVGPSAYIIPLDMLRLPRLDFMKLDLEGSETEAIRGAYHTIVKYKPVMIIELHNGQLKRQGSSSKELLYALHGLGYSVNSLYPNCTIGDTQLDILCEYVAS